MTYKDVMVSHVCASVTLSPCFHPMVPYPPIYGLCMNLTLVIPGDSQMMSLLRTIQNVGRQPVSRRTDAGSCTRFTLFFLYEERKEKFCNLWISSTTWRFSSLKEMKTLEWVSSLMLADRQKDSNEYIEPLHWMKGFSWWIWTKER